MLALALLAYHGRSDAVPLNSRISSSTGPHTPPTPSLRHPRASDPPPSPSARVEPVSDEDREPSQQGNNDVSPTPTPPTPTPPRSTETVTTSTTPTPLSLSPTPRVAPQSTTPSERLTVPTPENTTPTTVEHTNNGTPKATLTSTLEQELHEAASELHEKIQDDPSFLVEEQQKHDEESVKLRRFIVVFPSRSGSAFLNDLMNEHPGVTSSPLKECVNGRSISANWDGVRALGFNIPKRNDIGGQEREDMVFTRRGLFRAFLDACLCFNAVSSHCQDLKVGANEVEVVVTQLAYGQLNPDFFYEYIDERNIGIIHLWRNNLVRQYVSRKLADQNKVFHIDDQNAANLEEHQVAIDTKSFLQHTETQLAHETFWRMWGQTMRFHMPYFEICYETFLTEGRLYHLRSLLAFMGVRWVDTNFFEAVADVQLHKPLPCKEYISNYIDVLNYISYNLSQGTGSLWLCRRLVESLEDCRDPISIKPLTDICLFEKAFDKPKTPPHSWRAAQMPGWIDIN